MLVIHCDQLGTEGSTYGHPLLWEGLPRQLSWLFLLCVLLLTLNQHKHSQSGWIRPASRRERSSAFLGFGEFVQKFLCVLRLAFRGFAVESHMGIPYTRCRLQTLVHRVRVFVYALLLDFDETPRTN